MNDLEALVGACWLKAREDEPTKRLDIVKLTAEGFYNAVKPLIKKINETDSVRHVLFMEYSNLKEEHEALREKLARVKFHAS